LIFKPIIVDPSSVRDGTGQFCALSERVSRGRKSKFLSN
jgi:hypothetical protein